MRDVTQDDDFAQIAAIYATSWKTAYRGMVPQDYLDQLSADYWTEKLATMKYGAVLLRHGERYIGTSYYTSSRSEAFQGFGEVVSLYLLPEYFGQGLGQSLLQAAEERLYRQGFDRLHLWVLAENTRARRFYERNGYHLTEHAMELVIGGKPLIEIAYQKEKGSGSIS